EDRLRTPKAHSCPSEERQRNGAWASFEAFTTCPACPIRHLPEGRTAPTALRHLDGRASPRLVVLVVACAAGVRPRRSRVPPYSRPRRHPAARPRASDRAGR